MPGLFFFTAVFGLKTENKSVRAVDFRQRDGFLAIFLGDRAFSLHTSVLLADFIMKILRDLVVVGVDLLFFAVRAAGLDDHLAGGGFLKFALGAQRLTGDFDISGVEGQTERCERSESEGSDFFHEVDGESGKVLTGRQGGGAG